MSSKLYQKLKPSADLFNGVRILGHQSSLMAADGNIMLWPLNQIKTIHRTTERLYISSTDSDDLDYAFDNFVVPIEAFYPIYDKPYEISVKGWNLDDTFGHIITFLFTVVHPKVTSLPEVEQLSESEVLNLIGSFEVKEGN